MKSSIEKLVSLRTCATSAGVRREFVSMNSSTVWSGENISTADLRPMTSSTFWTSFEATQASPPRDQSIWMNARASMLRGLEAAERDRQLVDGLPDGVDLLVDAAPCSCWARPR